MNYFITGLPRSRTSWFANYFSSGESFCWHEGMRGVATKGEYLKRMALPGYKSVGNSDSGLCLGGYIEGCPLVIIERDIDEVEQAMADQGYPQLRMVLNFHKRKMDRMQGLRVGYYEINDRLQEIHEYCVDTPYDSNRAKQCMEMNIQLAELVPDALSAAVWR